jgi:tRNA A-37 threonylcarbamoyl transferase component Bud32
MELIEGESLRSRIDREHTLSPETALGIAIQVCEALAHAHGKGVLHRDIKPQNICWRTSRMAPSASSLSISESPRCATKHSLPSAGC